MKKYDYHTIVIGAGRTGSYFAKSFSKFKAKILVIDKNPNFGGFQFVREVPINVLNSLNIIFEKSPNMSIADKFSLFRSELNLKIHNLIENKNQKSFTKANIDTMIGEVKIIDKNSLEINNKKISFKYCVFAIGSRYLKPIIEGLDEIDYEKTENWFNYDKNFNSVTIIGNDKLSVELALALAKTGVIVYLLNRYDNFIYHLKDDLLKDFLKLNKSDNLHIINKIKFKSISKNEFNTYKIDYFLDEDEQSIFSDRLILGGMKKGNISNINSNIKFEINDRDFPITDRYLHFKNNKNFLAIGSCMGPYIDSNQGIYQANIVINNFINDAEVSKYDFYNYAININSFKGFSFIGMTLDDIDREKLKYHVFDYSFGNNDFNLINDETFGKIRAYFDKKHRLLNVAILGQNINEMASFFLWLYYSKTPFSDLNSLTTFDFTKFELIREMASEYLFEFVYNDKKISFIHKWYLKI